MTDEKEKELLNNLSPQRRRDFYVKKYYSEIYNKIVLFNIENMNTENFTQMVYNYVNNITECPKCRICESGVNFNRSYDKAYHLYCSLKCVQNDKELTEKRVNSTKKTLLKRYGSDNGEKLKSIQHMKKTNCMKKYGVEHYTQTDEFKQRIKETNIKKYGVEHYFNTDEYREKAKKTKIEKYGVDHHTKTDEFKQKMKDINMKKYGVEHYTQTEERRQKMRDFVNSDEYIKVNEKRINTLKLKSYELYKNYNPNYNFIDIVDIDVILECKKCNNQFNIRKQLYYIRTKKNMICCTYCNPKNGKNTSFQEKKVLEYIRSIYNGDIIENFKYNKYEIDIYLPDLKIGFEYNGLWFHSEGKKPRNYHSDKIDLFENIDISLYMIWEDNWLYKKDVIKDFIKNKIEKYKNCDIVKIEDCIIRNISNNENELFLFDNSIHNIKKSTICYGLEYNGNIVLSMSFNKSKSSKHKNIYELVQLCSKLETTIENGFKTIFEHFLNNYNPFKVISTESRCYRNIENYTKMGFVEIEKIKPDFYWTKKGFRYNRYSFRKDILVKRGFDKNISASDIMKNTNYYRTFDSGKIKFEFINIK